MEIRILHLYPDLMDLYGSHANVLVLRRCLEETGCTVTVERTPTGKNFREADVIYLGAGTERSQRAAMEGLSRWSGELSAAARDGVTLFFAGTAMELLGRSVREPDGSVYPGLGLAEFETCHERRRTVGDVYGYTALYPEPVVGYMNKCGRISGVETPLLKEVRLGWGNQGRGSSEGFHWNNVFASELTGPLLVKNPTLLETVAGTILRRRGRPVPKQYPADPWRKAAYETTEKALRERLG